PPRTNATSWRPSNTAVAANLGSGVVNGRSVHTDPFQVQVSLCDTVLQPKLVHAVVDPPNNRTRPVIGSLASAASYRLPGWLWPSELHAEPDHAYVAPVV